jgi:hypothetical protein
MMHESPLKPPATRSDDSVWIIVESKSFVDFDRWMDVQLGQLVDRWAYMAAPKAKLAGRLQRRFDR